MSFISARERTRIRTRCRRSRAAMLAMALAIVVCCGCSDNSEPEPKSTPAPDLCAGTLDTAAVAALRRLADTDQFIEDSGGGKHGQPRLFSLPWTAAHLHDPGIRLAECGIDKAKHDGTYWGLNLDFTAASAVPTRDQIANDFPVARYGRLTYFPTGETAYVQGDSIATLYFACRTRGNDRETPYVRAGSITNGHLEGDSKAKDHMAIVSSVSRRLAAELGCADEANLPTTVPNPEGS
ncbi:hypothetical protein OG432_07225 [Streptomyces sp. NBC_00442]|uniref:hypothetical protein n=1 Tax=Streptomyces sp. NBC_00442 TaxID=2903651 RepID=UPI002E1E5DF4